MKTWKWVVWGVAIGTICLHGCSIRAPRPETRYYTLSLAIPESSTKAGKGSLIVRSISVRHPYDQERIVYRSSAYTFDRYNAHRWASSPGEQVTEWTRRYLRHADVFAHVYPTTSGSADFFLDGVVRQFEEIDHEHQWEAALTIDMWLLRPGDATPTWFKTYSATRPAAKRNPEAVAEAMSHCLEDVLERLAADLGAVVATQLRP
ncbi:MAG: ABC-type transport auxiliary lipoprotein family protein [Candidatus Binatia bacterium]